MNDPLDFCHPVWPTHSEYAKRWLNRFPEWDTHENDHEHLLTCIDNWLEKSRELTDEKSIDDRTSPGSPAQYGRNHAP